MFHCNSTRLHQIFNLRSVRVRFDEVFSNDTKVTLISTSNLRSRALSTSTFDDTFNTFIKQQHPESGLVLQRREGKGRLLTTNIPFRINEVVFSEEPLIAVESPTSKDSTCSVCFLALNTNSKNSNDIDNFSCLDCGSKFCSKECKSIAFGQGSTHDVLCGTTGKSPEALLLLNTFCKEHNLNFPRVAAAAVAKSLTSNFEDFWNKTNRLASLSLGAEETLPASFTTSFTLVKQAVSRGLGGDTEAFFTHAFNLRAYARFMGTLRLNAISIKCPLNGKIEDDEEEDRKQRISTSSMITNSVNGCCSASAEPTTTTTTIAPVSSSCGSDPSSCSSHEVDEVGTILRAAERSPGSGTALYATASLLNHNCSPNLNITMSAGGHIALVASRDINIGEELSITYIDANLPKSDRLRTLRHAYGFECTCSRCQEER
jgi:hypothetical protein